MGQVIILLLKLICFHFIDEDTEVFLCHFPRVAETWYKWKNMLYPLLCYFSETLKHPGPFIREMEFRLLPAPGSPWGCPGFASEVAQSPCSLESIYPMYPICRCVYIHLCACMCIIHIYIVCGNSKSCAPFFPEASRRRSDIWLELSHTHILSLVFTTWMSRKMKGKLFSQWVPKDHEKRDTLFCLLSPFLLRSCHTPYVGIKWKTWFAKSAKHCCSQDGKELSV